MSLCITNTFSYVFGRKQEIKAHIYQEIRWLRKALKPDQEADPAERTRW
jgi:hypothetical protein